MKNSAGKLEEHYIEPKTGTVYKVQINFANFVKK